MTELADAPRTEPARRASRLAGVEVNELLTSSAAALLTILLIAEGITILDLAACSARTCSSGWC